ncbi:MAG: nucleoside hydrolase [Sulfolobales archaeon]
MIKAVLDMDPGVDDAVALIMALGLGDIEVLGVTIVSGNVHVDQGVRNALRILSYLGRNEIKVYKGSEKPLIRDLVTSEHIHGADGLGDSGIPEGSGRVSGNAISFIVETLRREKAFIVATGPLTNIARAVMADPWITRNIEGIIVMGGAFGLTRYGKGNVTPNAEYNFYVDPEAAKIVIRSGVDPKIVSLDVTQDPRARVSKDNIEEIRRIGSRAGELVYRILRNPVERLGYFELHDAIALSTLIDPEVVRFRRFHISIDTCWERGRSRIVSDPSEADGAAYLSYDLNAERFFEILRYSLR